MPRKRSNEEFYDDMIKLHPDFEISGEYNNSRSKIHVKHLICNYEWDMTAQSLYKHGCPKCGKAVLKTQDEFENELNIAMPHLKIIGEYKGGAKKIAVYNTCCGHSYEAIANNILRGSDCPICAGKQVLEGYNDIHTTDPETAALFVDQNETYNYSANSHSKVLMRCPDCGHIEMKIIKGVHI